MQGVSQVQMRAEPQGVDLKKSDNTGFKECESLISLSKSGLIRFFDTTSGCDF